jgi:GTPase Era involved in 16S rRNA processing
MTKIVNLDKLATKRDKVVVLGGVEHVMTTLTVKDYIQQMKASSQISELINASDDSVDSAEKIMQLTIEALMKLFPTITHDEFESLNMDQLTAIRELAEDAAHEEAPAAENEAGE